MDNVNWYFSGKFRSHWIKVKFYKEKPKNNDVKILKNIKFCEATKEAILRSILLDKKVLPALVSSILLAGSRFIKMNY